MSFHTDMTEEDFSGQEFTGNLDVQARTGKKLTRRQFLELMGLSAAGLVLAACEPVVAVAQPASTKELTEDASKRTPQKTTDQPYPTGGEPTEQTKPTPSPEPTKVPVEIVGVEVKSVAQNKEVLEKLLQVPLIHSLISGADLEHNEKGWLIDKLKRVNMPELVPVHTLINAKTNDGQDQHLLIVRHPEQSSSGEIIQQSYLIVGRRSDGKYIDPIQAKAEEIVALPLSEFARLNGHGGTLTSPFGGTINFDAETDVKMFGLADALDYQNHGILSFDPIFKHINDLQLSADRPVLGNPDKQTNLPFCVGTKYVYDGIIYRSMQYYLEIQHPELVEQALNQHPEVSYERKKAPSSGEEYLQMTYTPLDMTPVFRTYIMNLDLPIGAEEAEKPGDNFDGSITIDAIPDKSDRGWGVFIYKRHINESYAFSNQPLPHNLISLEAKAKISFAGQPLIDNIDRYFRSVNSTSLAELRTASQQLTDPSNPNFGIIPDAFALNMFSRFNP